MPLTEMYEWAMVAKYMAEEEKEKHNVQKIGPGL
jgi:hypothetical protein